MVVTTDLKLVGTLSVRNFLTDFAEFNHKADPFVEEMISNYIKMDIQMTGKRHATIFTYYDVYYDGTEKEIDELDLELGFAEKYEDGYKCQEMVHWGLYDVKSNVGKVIFYIHYEDWSALYNYLSMLNDELDIKEVKFEIRGYDLIINEEFAIKLYN